MGAVPGTKKQRGMGVVSLRPVNRPYYSLPLRRSPLKAAALAQNDQPVKYAG